MLHINMNMIISISTTCYYTFAASIFINSIRKNFILFIIFPNGHLLCFMNNSHDLY